MMQGMEPPVASAQDGADPYAWMRDTSDPAMLEYLAAERAYYDQETAHTVRLRDKLQIKKQLDQQYCAYQHLNDKKLSAKQ